MSDLSSAQGTSRRRRRHLLRSRVLCVDEHQLLLVEHENSRTGERFWMLPGGAREPGETFEQAALRETKEETGLDVRLVRRLRVPGSVEDVTYALFLAVPITHQQPAPREDFSHSIYLRGACWYPIAIEHPIGPLNPTLWGFLAPLLVRLASGTAGRVRRQRAIQSRS